MTLNPPSANEERKQQRQRIPVPLQDVYTESCRGKDVIKAPTNGLGAKTFHRNWIFQSRRGGGDFGNGKNGSNSLDDIMPFGISQAKGVPVCFSKSARKLTVESSVSNRKSVKSHHPKRSPPASKNESSSVAAKTMDPKAYLDLMMGSRGYSTRKYRTLKTGYYAKPTALQRASYSVNIIRLVQQKDCKKLKAILGAGLSPNPCNAYGESLIHMICRRGNSNLLKVQLGAGAIVQVSDDYGRTPLHDVCWRKKPCFEMVELLAEKDINLFNMIDKYGCGPLSYTRKDQWQQWNDFLESKKDKWWPVREKEIGEQLPSPFVEMFPDSRRIPNPPNALTVELAKMVANGTLSPDEAHLLNFDQTCSRNFDNGDDSDDSDDSNDELDDDSVRVLMNDVLERRRSTSSSATY